MPEKAAFLAFLVAAFALNLAPGPDMLYVIGRSVGQGRKAGIVSSLGVFVGCWVHILAAAFGIAALLRSSPMAFNVSAIRGRSLPDLSGNKNAGAENQFDFTANEG